MFLEQIILGKIDIAASMSTSILLSLLLIGIVTVYTQHVSVFCLKSSQQSISSGLLGLTNSSTNNKMHRLAVAFQYFLPWANIASVVLGAKCTILCILVPAVY